MPPTIQERFATETFVNGVCDLMKMLQVFRCQTSADALIRALEVEAAFITTRTCDKVSVAEKNNKREKLSEELLQQIDGLFGRRKNDMTRK